MTNRSDLTHMLDELVVQIASYPVLLFCLLFNPKRVYQSDWGGRLVPCWDHFGRDPEYCVHCYTLYLPAGFCRRNLGVNGISVDAFVAVHSPVDPDPAFSNSIG